MRAYRWLLRAYPRSFRDEYADEMCAIFARRRRDARGAQVPALWAEAIADTLANALRAQADILGQDLRQAGRTLLRTPGFTAAVVLVAAMGIGATTAAFSIADHVLVRPLPFVHAERLVKLYQDQSFRGYSRTELSPPNYADWKRMSTSFDAMAAYHTRSANFLGLGDPVRLDGVAATTDLFQVLGAQAALGRIFTSADERPGAPDVVLLSHDVWSSLFGGDPDVLGRAVTLDDTPYTIVGVMPAGFRFPTRATAFWTARRWVADDFAERANNYLLSIARLKEGVSIEQARAELGAIASELARRYPTENARNGATVIRLRDEVTRQARLMLVAIAGAAICVLLIACTNLASLLLTRSLARRKELAVRAAIGAGRHRLVRQMLTESLVLASLGGVAGVWLAAMTSPLIARLVPTALPIAETPGIDWRMLLGAGIITTVAGLTFGIAPALRLSRGDDLDTLNDARQGPGRRTERFRSALVVAQVTASVVLLVSAGLLIRALWRVEAIDPGFRSEGVLTVRTTLPMPQYEATWRREQLYRRVLSEVRASPGVSEAAYVSFLPMVMRGGIWPVEVDGREPDGSSARTASLRFVTPRFFAAMGIPLRQGRDVRDSDTMDTPLVAVVSESFAREHWPDRNPIGRQFAIGLRDRRVVGVVGDVHVRGLERESEPQVYLPSAQVPDGGLIFYAPKDLVIKASVPPASLVAAVRAIVARADPRLPVSNVQPLADIVDAETAPRRVQLGVLGSFAGIAILLAAIGIHGLLAFTVSSRTREFGVRMALGAEPARLFGRVLGEGLMLAAAGVVLGVVLSLWAGRAMESLLAGVSPVDGATLATAVVSCLVTAAAGSTWPAVRVLRINPIAAIREE